MEDGEIEVWDAEALRVVVRFRHLDKRVVALGFSPDGRTLASIGRYDPDVNLWDASRGVRKAVFRLGSSDPASLAYSPDSRTLAMGATDGTITLWAPADGEARNTFQAHYRGVAALAFSPDGSILASGGADMTEGHPITVKLWNTREILDVPAQKRETMQASRFRCTVVARRVTSTRKKFAIL
jgi:WD40 repeat protein